MGLVRSRSVHVRQGVVARKSCIVQIFANYFGTLVAQHSGELAKTLVDSEHLQLLELNGYQNVHTIANATHFTSVVTTTRPSEQRNPIVRHFSHMYPVTKKDASNLLLRRKRTWNGEDRRHRYHHRRHRQSYACALVWIEQRPQPQPPRSSS